MPETSRPGKLTLRAYKVGFGDCFLLTFHYPSTDRHILIDFGSSGTDEAAGSKIPLRAAEDIREQCGGKLHAVVATHRHRDHISGFTTAKNGKGPGDIIAALKPEVVVQPWTEDPEAATDAKKATAVESNRKAFVASLASMQAFSAELARALPSLKASANMTRQISFLGETNLANLAAVRNLQSMGRKNFYVNFGSRCGLEELLPGVDITVLGPPNLEQSSEVGRERSSDAAEFWQLQANAQSVAYPGAKPLFPGAPVWRPHPPHTRWLIRKMNQMRGEQLLSIVRALDSAMNNTSVILLFDTGGKKLLFPGDAQIENWSYALSQAGIRKLLAGVDVYKVGHHGSRNATPKSLWELFWKRSNKESRNRLISVLSTMKGKHGDPRSRTEVPRVTLVEALEKESEYHTTQNIRGRNIREDITIDL